MNFAKCLLISIHIHIYENCSANAFSKIFDRRDVTHFLGDYKGAGAVSGPAKK